VPDIASKGCPLMPQPSPERPTLDSFLPQFAAPSDQPNKQQSESNGASHTAHVNGRFSEFETVEINGHLEDHSRIVAENAVIEDAVIEDAQNGAHGHSAVERADSSAPLHRGNGAAHRSSNGLPTIESSLKGAMTEILASTASPSDSMATVGSNGAANVEIGNQAGASVVGDVEALPEVETGPSDDAEERQPDADPRLASPSEHPAAGSLFTPYLVTEIRELRNRCRRRSWWQRLFG